MEEQAVQRAIAFAMRDPDLSRLGHAGRGEREREVKFRYLAAHDSGASCFFVARWLPGGA